MIASWTYVCSEICKALHAALIHRVFLVQCTSNNKEKAEAHHKEGERRWESLCGAARQQPVCPGAG